LSISEFAELCKVAQPTVSRFCRSVGFASYVALRLGIAADFAADGQLRSQSGSDEVAGIAGSLRSDSGTSQAAQVVRTSTRVEIWPAPELAATGETLATMLAALDVSAVSTLAPSHWIARAQALPAGSAIILLGTPDHDAGWEPGLAAAAPASPNIIYVSARPRNNFVKAASHFIPIPGSASISVGATIFAETFAKMVKDISGFAGPSGPASPWREWPHTETLFLPMSTDPVPALLLAQPRPTRKRSLVIFYARIGASKEELAPPHKPTERVTPHLVAALLNAGHDVLLPDGPAQGARKRDWEDTCDLIRAGIEGGGPNYLEEFRTETSELIDAVLDLGIVDSANRIAVTGQSGGGFQTILKLAGDPRISCGVAIMPIVDLTQLPEFADLNDNPRLISNNVHRNMGAQLAPRPLLLLGGGQDTTAPAEKVRAFGTGIRRAYSKVGARDLVQYVELDDVGHRFDSRQVDAMLAFLDQHLLGDTKSRPNNRRSSK
jgi:dienelactone hydrolase